jgi:hypothetical protein
MKFGTSSCCRWADSLLKCFVLQVDAAADYLRQSARVDEPDVRIGE